MRQCARLSMGTDSGLAVTRQRLNAEWTPAPRRLPALPARDSVSPSTPVPSTASIRRLEAAMPMLPVSATTPPTAGQRSASSMAQSMSSSRLSPATTSRRPASIP